MLRIHPVTTFSATSCSVVRAMPGDTTACAGCVMTSSIAVIAPSTYDEQRRRPEQQSSSCGTHRDRLRRVRAQQDPRRAEAIDQRAGERREESRWHEQRERDDTGRGCAPLRVGVHEHGDPGSELGQSVQPQRGRLPAQHAVDGELTNGRRSGGQGRGRYTDADARHRGRTSSGTGEFNVADFYLLRGGRFGKGVPDEWSDGGRGRLAERVPILHIRCRRCRCATAREPQLDHARRYVRWATGHVARSERWQHRLRCRGVSRGRQDLPIHRPRPTR